MGLKYINQNGEEVIIAGKGKNGKDGKDGGVSTGSVIGWTGEEIPEGYEEVDSSLIPSGVEVGTIVDWDDTQPIPEGWELVESGYVYSTEETFTGKYWIDGKKIYKKTITGGLTEASPMHIIIGQNIEDFIDTYGFIRANAPTPINTYWSEGLKSLTQQHYNNPNQLDIYFGSDFKNTPFEVTVEYTKTTD